MLPYNVCVCIYGTWPNDCSQNEEGSIALGKSQRLTSCYWWFVRTEETGKTIELRHGLRFEVGSEGIESVEERTETTSILFAVWGLRFRASNLKPLMVGSLGLILFLRECIGTGLLEISTSLQFLELQRLG